jgi:phosphoribosylglycinamide formyltransferase-1
LSAKLRLGVLASGGGRSLENLAQRIQGGELDAQIAVVVTNTAEAFALERAARLQIPSAVVSHKVHSTAETLSAAVFAVLDEQRVDLAVLAGWLRLLVIPPRWIGRVINIHPSLLPAFGGKGYFGERVHQAVIDRGVQFTGCTVHYVTNEYDAGPILLQRCIPVLPTDDAHSLAARVFEEEKLALPEAIRRHARSARA